MTDQTQQTKEPTAANGSARAATQVLPRTNIREEKERYVLELEMPGVGKEGLEITVENGELTILGHRTDAQPPGELLYRESRPLDYRRVFDLDPSIDSGHIVARIEQGVLTLTLPKAESVKPRKIVVTD